VPTKVAEELVKWTVEGGIADGLPGSGYRDIGDVTKGHYLKSYGDIESDRRVALPPFPS